MRPFYEDDMTRIYLGDCRELAAGVADASCVITDPPWTGADPDISGSERPGPLWGELAAALPPSVLRVAIHLGSATDPAPYVGPMVLPFFRAAWLRYRIPRPRGRMLTGADVAYLYGPPPPSRPGARVIPGEVSANARPRRGTWSHPCPRSVTHVAWLVEYWSAPDDVVLDPFGGSGTTAVACRAKGRRCVLIEREERYCEIAATRCSQEELFHAVP